MTNINENYEVIDTREEESNSILAVDNIDRLLKQASQADKALEALKKVMLAALKITTENDWVLIGGKPYLQESGATKIGKLSGISWKIISTEITVDAEGYKTFYYRMKFFDQSTSIEADGSRNMKDDFFAKQKDGLKKPDEIDERDVKAAAYTNCVNTGIKRMIPGLRGLEKHNLTEAGLNVDKLKGYDFNSTTPKEMNEESKNLKNEIARMIKEASGGDVEVARKLIKKYTSFEKSDGSLFEGYDDINKVSEKSMSITYSKVKKGYEDWKLKQEGVPNDSSGN